MSTFQLSLLGIENVKGHATSVPFLPNMQNVNVIRRKHQATPQPRSSSTCLTREAAQEMQREALGAQQQSEHCRVDAWDVGALRRLLCWFSA